MNDAIIGHVPFTDGCERAVCQASEGRQYVVDGAGLPVFGMWIRSAEGDLSIIVRAPDRAGRRRSPSEPSGLPRDEYR